MKHILKTEFKTKEGNTGNIITRKRTDGLFVTTFLPALGLDFYTIDADRNNSHETVKDFLRDVKGCVIKGDRKKAINPQINKKRFIL